MYSKQPARAVPFGLPVMGGLVECIVSKVCARGQAKWTVTGAVVVVAAFLIGFSIKKLDTNEYGLQYDVRAKSLSGEAVEGGLHLGPVGYRFVKYPSTFINTRIPEDTQYPERLGSCVSRDGLRVNIKAEFQYQMPEDKVDEATLRFRDLGRWKKMVTTAGVSAIQKGCSLFDTSSFQSQRGLIQQAMFEALTVKLDAVYAIAVGLQLSYVQLPLEYSDAVAAKQAANEDIGLAKNQRQQQLTIAEQALQTAVEQANILNANANNDRTLRVQEATLRAEAIDVEFETEAQVYGYARETLGLSEEGLLAYIANRALEGATPGSLDIAISEPARSQWRDEL